MRNIHKPDHCYAEKQYPEVAAFEIPTFFIKPSDCPKANHDQKRSGPNADDTVIHTQTSGNLQRRSDGNGADRTSRISQRRRGRQQ